MTSTKVIDILNTLNFVKDYNLNGLSTSENIITINNDGILTLYNTQPSYNSSSGTLVIQNGGLAINSTSESLYVKGDTYLYNVYINGSVTYTNPLASNNFAYLTLTGSIPSNNVTTGTLLVSGGVSIKCTELAVSSTNGGSLTVAGGIGIKKNLYVDGKSNFIDIETINLTSNNLITTYSTISNVNNIHFTNGNIGINNTSPQSSLDLFGILKIDNTSGELHKLENNTLTDIFQIKNNNNTGGNTIQFLNYSGNSQASFGLGNTYTPLFQNTFYLSTMSGIPIKLSAGNNTNYPIIINAGDNSLSITSTTQSIDSDTGSLKVSGGASIKKDVYIEGSINFNNNVIYKNIVTEFVGTFNAANNIGTPTDVTGLLFSLGLVRSFYVILIVKINATSSLYAQFTIEGIQTASNWFIYDSYIGDDTGITFSITSGGQIQYTSTNISGYTSSIFDYKTSFFKI